MPRGDLRTAPPDSRPIGPGLHTATPGQVRAKRLLDLVGSSLLLIVLLPVMLLVAAAVAVGSRGPVFYTQPRVGRDGTTFTIRKFRSMVLTADEQRSDLVHHNQSSGPTFKIDDDPRTTAVGRTIRRFSLDELPQLFNVLEGSMSLVGPRPALPDEVAAYTPHQRHRLLVTPGLTCVWQVSGRADVGFDEWVEMDLAYIQQWTPWLDLVILARTLPAVVSGRGAY